MKMDATSVRHTNALFQNQPLPTAKENFYYIPEKMADKGSAFLKVGAYVASVAAILFPAAVSTASLTSLSRSLKAGGSFGNLLSVDDSADNLAKGIKKVQDSLQHPNGTVSSMAETLLLQSFYALEKTDSILSSLETLGIPDGSGAKAVHGVGYAASLALAIKDLIDVQNTLDEIENPETRETLASLKKVKFGMSAGAAFIGFFTLFSASVKLSLLWIVLAGAATFLSIYDYFYEKAVTEKSTEKAIDKQYQTAPSFSLG